MISVPYQLKAADSFTWERSIKCPDIAEYNRTEALMLNRKDGVSFTQ